MYEKIAIFSDPHLGAHQNDPRWHDISLNYAKWLVKTIDKSVVRLIVPGDIFNNRDEIGVSTIEVAEQFFKILSERFNIIVIAGNHDSFYKEHSKVSSISILNNKTNIKVVSKNIEIIEIDSEKIMLVPWGMNDDIPNFGRVRTIFGHFEINTFKRTFVDVCKTGVNSSFFLKYCDTVFSGHFHLIDERKYSNGKIIYVGSPYEITWNDSNSKKGVYIYCPKTDEYEFVENNYSPKHIEINADSILKNEKIEMIKGNFIKLITNPDFDYKKIDLILSKVSSEKPMDITNSFSKSETQDLSTIPAYQSVVLKDSLTAYIQNIDTNVDRKELTEVMIDLHDKANGGI